MRYVTISELSQMIRSNLWKIPHDIDLVIGIPRSGLMAANMVALYLNKRLSDIDSFVDGRILPCGETRSQYVSNDEIRKILVVDDSVNEGAAMAKAKQKLAPLFHKYEFIFFAPITTSSGSRLIDIYAEIIDGRRIFEWNLFHHSIINEACLDMDGVLCCDPEVDDDGEIYSNFIKNAPPLFIPTTHVGTIVTCRLEKYRSITEDWLKRNHVEYNKLLMLDFPNRDARRQWGKHGEYKGEYYKNSSATLFIESSKQQAEKIAAISQKPVICIETNSLIEVPKTDKRPRSRIITLLKRYPNLYRRIKGLYRKLSWTTKG